MLATNFSSAQDYKLWRVIDLGQLGTPDGLVPSGDISYGINTRGEVVGGMTMPDGDVHAFIWLPVAAYTLPAGLHDLHDLADLDELGIDESVATAINDFSQVVSGAGDGIVELGEAWLWHVDDTTGGPTNPDTPSESLHNADGLFSIAHGINNASPPEVVGMADFLCDNIPGVRQKFGFLRTVDPSSDMEKLLPAGGSVQSMALDVLRTSTQLWIAGHDDATGTCNNFLFTPGCHAEDRDGLIWQTIGGPSVVLDRWMPPGGVQARSVNNQGNSVGLGFAEDPEGNECPITALRWDSSGDFSNLGAVMPTGQAGDNSRAEAIGNPQFGHVRVAGSNETDFRVYVWEHNGVGAWSAPNLCVVDVHDELVACGQTLTFEFTHDMNNNGHLVVHAKDIQQNAHVVVLGCVADINHDMRVNGTDRDLMHLAYGACGNCNNCPSDLDCDCDVDATDLAQLLATWSATAPCRIVNFCPGPEGGEGFAGGQTLEEAMNSALEVSGFSSAEEFLDWTASVDSDTADDASLLIHILMTE